MILFALRLRRCLICRDAGGGGMAFAALATQSKAPVPTLQTLQVPSFDDVARRWPLGEKAQSVTGAP